MQAQDLSKASKSKRKRNRRNKKKKGAEDSNSITEHSHQVNSKNNPQPDFTPLKDVITDSFFNE